MDGFDAMMANAFRWIIGATDVAIVATERMSENAVSSIVFV